MNGPLSPDMYNTSRWPDSWWCASAPDWALPATDLPDRTDVAIIGGGYAGLACAARLAEHGIGAVVLEAGQIGWGASGRNGGIVGLGAHKLSEAKMRARYGADEVARYDAAFVDGLHRIRAFCDEAGLGVMLQGSGEVVLAHSARALRGLLSEPAAPGTLREKVAASGAPDLARLGGVRLSPAFGVHPLRLVRALAETAASKGVRLCENAEVTAWHRMRDGHEVKTAKGTLIADRVVLATNGFTPDGVIGPLDGRAVPVISNIAVTRVLTPEERARHPWLRDDPVVDTRNLLVYLRMLPEGRLLFGMRGDLSGSERGAAAMKARVARRIAQCFPGWADISIAHFWRGPICATARYTPSVGRHPDDPTLAFAFGWHGSGINGAQVGGRLLADALAAEDDALIPAPMRGIAPALPVPSLRPVYVAAALLQQRLSDALS